MPEFKINDMQDMSEANSLNDGVEFSCDYLIEIANKYASKSFPLKLENKKLKKKNKRLKEALKSKEAVNQVLAKNNADLSRLLGIKNKIIERLMIEREV